MLRASLLRARSALAIGAGGSIAVVSLLIGYPKLAGVGFGIVIIGLHHLSGRDC